MNNTPAPHEDAPGKESVTDGSRTEGVARKHSEANLREIEWRYRRLFEGAPDAVFLVSVDPADAGRILDANELAATIHGSPRGELLKLKIGDVDTPESARLAPERIRAIARDGRAVFEVTHRRKDGSEFPLEVTAPCEKTRSTSATASSKKWPVSLGYLRKPRPFPKPKHRQLTSG